MAIVMIEEFKAITARARVFTQEAGEVPGQEEHPLPFVAGDLGSAAFHFRRKMPRRGKSQVKNMEDAPGKSPGLPIQGDNIDIP